MRAIKPAFIALKLGTFHLLGAVRKLLMREVPQPTGWGLYLPVATVIAFYAGWEYLMVIPGYSIAALALVAVIMTVRADHFTPAERVIWVLIGAALMMGEMRVLYLDRHSSEIQQARDQQQQEQRFETTINSFTVLLKKEDRTLREADSASINSERGLENITGGKTFIVLTRSWGGLQETSSGAQPMWTAFSKGGAMLHSVSVEIWDMDKMQGFFNEHRTGGASFYQLEQLQTVVQLGDFASTFGRIVYIPLLPQMRTARLSMNFFAMNGMWSELYACREINGSMAVAIKVTRNRAGKNKVIFNSIDKSFPVDAMGRPLDEKGTPMWN